MVSLDECKNYLKVETDDDDSLIEILMDASIRIVKDMLRVEDFKDFKKKEKKQIKAGIFYTLRFLYNERGNADHKDLMLTLRALLSNLRRPEFWLI